MSQQSQKHILVFNPNVYVLYFRHLAEKLGAKYDLRQPLTYQITLLADLPVSDKKIVHLRMALGWSFKGTCWVLREMTLSPSYLDTVNPSEELLPLYAKRLADKENDLDRPNDEVWIFRSARDLGALFEAYDKLAHDWGRVPLFGH